jgi:SNF2 family DNA or RNA helicase
VCRIWNHPSCLESTTGVLDADSDVDDDMDGGGRKRKNNSNTQIPHPDVAPGQPWYGDLLSESSGYVAGRVEDSGKMLICMFILASALHQKEKVLIFTQSLDMLDLFENVLATYFDLSKNDGYFRLDGSTSASDRYDSIAQFNDEDSSARVYLISTKAVSCNRHVHAVRRAFVVHSRVLTCRVLLLLSSSRAVSV